MSFVFEPILGEISALTISSPDLDKSLSFYKQLGFKEIMRFDFPFPWIQITDGALLIMLKKSDNPYIALTYYVKNIESLVSTLEAKGVNIYEKPTPSDMVKRHLIKSPDGVNISLVTYMEGFQQPAGPTMLTMPQTDYFNPDKYVNKACGMFGEFAHPVIDMNASIAFWELLGFKVLSKFESPYPWAIISDGLSVVGLHQSTHFSYPAMTFFASDMLDKIEAIKASGIDCYDESRGAGNLILTTPEQQHIFLFKMGM
ncbi:MAG: VOC family protein [Bacteroidota bacterium]